MNPQQAFALAFQHHQAGRLADAEALYRQILAVDPRQANAWYLLGAIALQVGKSDRAVALIKQALVLQPDHSGALTNLGEACRRLGRLEEALTHFRQACALNPSSPESHYNLGTVLGELHQEEEAIAAFRRAVELLPTFAQAHCNLGTLYWRAGRRGEGVAAWHRALELKPDYADAHYNLANALRERGRLDQAIEEYGRVLQMESNSPDALCNMGVALSNRGQHDEGISCFRQAVACAPSTPRYLSNLIYALQFLPRGGGNAVREEKALWNERFTTPLRRAWKRFDNVADPQRRLRIGYVSPSFHSNAVAFFLVPLLEAHDRSACEIYCYARMRRSDAVTERFRKSADVWRDAGRWTDAQWAESVRADGIDIFVDLAMHAGDNRLSVFAHKPAPVQVSWLAYPGSTGMEAMDYRLTDARLEPPGEEAEAGGEEPVRLPDVWCCYEPIEDFPPVGPPPAMKNGRVTFGSLNQFNKINEDLLCCWARLLVAVPESRLVMICPEGEAQTRTRDLFSSRGVDPERIECVAQRAWSEYVELFTKIDIALDAYPHNGMTTTCHTLWMGVPAITRPGTTPVSRAGSSLLHAVDLSDWVAQTDEEYIRIAVAWSNDLPRLAELRSTLRERMQASPLMDAPRFARNVEAAFRTMWERWCAKQSSSTQ